MCHPWVVTPDSSRCVYQRKPRHDQDPMASRAVLYGMGVFVQSQVYVKGELVRYGVE